MAKLAYCNVCRATYPMAVVQPDAGRTGKAKEPACPMGHTDIEQLDTLPKRPRAKK